MHILILIMVILAIISPIKALVLGTFGFAFYYLSKDKNRETLIKLLSQIYNKLSSLGKYNLVLLLSALSLGALGSFIFNINSSKQQIEKENTSYVKRIEDLENENLSLSQEVSVLETDKSSLQEKITELKSKSSSSTSSTKSSSSSASTSTEEASSSSVSEAPSQTEMSSSSEQTAQFAQPPAPQQPEEAQDTNRTVYVARGGSANVYWYSMDSMPPNTNFGRVVSMTEQEAINSGKRHSLRE